MAKERTKRTNSTPSPGENIVQVLMDRPMAVPTNIKDLPSDVAALVRAVEGRPLRREMRRKFTGPVQEGAGSVILAHFDKLKEEGHPNPAGTAMGTYYQEFIRPIQGEWTQEELTAFQQGPDRSRDRAERERKASLRRIDALIDKLGD